MQLLNWTTILLLCLFIKNISAGPGDENAMPKADDVDQPPTAGVSDGIESESETNEHKNTGKEEDEKENGLAGVINDDDDADDKPPTSESDMGTETDDENKHIGNDELMAKGDMNDDDDVGDGNVGNRGVTEDDEGERRNEAMEEKREEKEDEDEVVKDKENGEEGGFSQMEEPRTVGENNEFGGTFGDETDEPKLDSQTENREFDVGNEAMEKEEFAGNRMEETDEIPPAYSTSESKTDNDEPVHEVQKVRSAAENVQMAHHGPDPTVNTHHDGKDKGEGNHHEDHHKKDEMHKKLAGEGTKSSKKLEGSNSSKNLHGEGSNSSKNLPAGAHDKKEEAEAVLKQVLANEEKEKKLIHSDSHLGKSVKEKVEKGLGGIKNLAKEAIKAEEHGNVEEAKKDVAKIVKDEKDVEKTLKDDHASDKDSTKKKVKKDVEKDLELMKHLEGVLAHQSDAGAAGGNGQTLPGVLKELTNLEPNLKKHEMEAEKQHDKKGEKAIKEADNDVKEAETDLKTGKFKEAEKVLEKAKGKLNEAEHSEQALHTKEGMELATKLEGDKKAVEHAKTEIKKAEQSGGKGNAEIEEELLSDAGKKLKIVETDAKAKKLEIVAKDVKEADAAVVEAEKKEKQNAKPEEVVKKVSFAEEKVIEGIVAAKKEKNGIKVAEELGTVQSNLSKVLTSLKSRIGKGWEAAVGAFKSLKDKMKHLTGLGSKPTHDNAKHNDAAGKDKHKALGQDSKHKEADGKGSAHGRDGNHKPNAHHRK